MFFPEHLLSRSGPLARVWLAANYDKKLSKNQVLLDKIRDDIDVILAPEVTGGPLALRLSGQLLYGVVRIYSRKAFYLLDDCNEALLKIKMAFRPGNIDLPGNQSHVANPASLTLPDVLTELDLLAPMPDPSLLLSQVALDLNLPGLNDTALSDWDNSQFLSGSIEQPRLEPMNLDDADDLELDLGEEEPVLDFDEGTSIERGRNAPLERRLSDHASSPKILEEDDLGLDFGEDPDDSAFSAAPELNLDLDMDVDTVAPFESTVAEDAVPPQRERGSASPLSELGSEAERELETLHEQDTTTFEPQEEEDETIHQPQKAKRRKLLHADADTQISNSQIREQQNDRTKILKPASFLPRDPMLLALMNMQKSGGFVSSLLGDGRSRGWAPELRGILSLEVVARPSQKRKRDSGVADLETEDEEAVAGTEKTPQLEFDQTELEIGGMPADFGGDTSFGQGEDLINLPSDNGIVPRGDGPEEDDDAYSQIPDNFDDTTAPLLYPAESGPVSVGTKHAVHILRDRFGPAPEGESEAQKTSVLFQDMLPEATTTKAEATKMFFEILVLATKDAVKVEQSTKDLGGPLRIRGRRGLWGDWAEISASGEPASQNAPEGSFPAAVEA